ncbi:MAG: amidohydrolase family protein [Pseudomonadota bacterium]
MNPSDLPAADANNAWRLDTPGNAGWVRTAHADAPNKFFMCSADGHVQEPKTFLADRIDAKYRERLPGVLMIPAKKPNEAKDGDADEASPEMEMYQKTEGFRPTKILWTKPLEGTDRVRDRGGRNPETRIAELALDGCDAEVMFPNKGLTMWATPDAEFSHAMCRAYNDWAWEDYGPYNDRLAPMGAIAPGALDLALDEIQRVAKLGFKGLSLPCKPTWGPPDVDDPNYNLKEFEPLWDCIEDVDLPITFHVSTGRDPRTSRSQGGAVINYTIHSLLPTTEPIANICASGVAERHPGLRFGTIEAGIGWVPFLLEAMDEAYRKHHMWVRPKLDGLPSDYFRRQGFASFQEDHAGLLMAREFDLVENFLWANDFPHHEGSWPYSAQAIERTMGHLDDGERAKILGLNAARIFKFDIPERYRHQPDVAAVAAQIGG